jgi:preprotein translocase subunit SecE
MIPWYSVTCSDGLEEVFVSYKLIIIVLIGMYFFLYLIEKLIKRLFK